jgi:hypothetical protein
MLAFVLFGIFLRRDGVGNLGSTGMAELSWSCLELRLSYVELGLSYLVVFSIVI